MSFATIRSRPGPFGGVRLDRGYHVRVLPDFIRSRPLTYLLHAVIWCGLGVVGTLAVTKRFSRSPVELSESDDLVRWADVLRDRQVPPRVIYLQSGPIVLTPGVDASHENRSSVLLANKVTEAKLPGFSGSPEAWQAITRCVKAQFAPFAIEVTDERPTDPGYVMAIVGGHPHDLGMERKSGGLAPFSGGVIEDPVVFAFASRLGNAPRAVCETITKEVAHAFGLDHGYLCADVMSYLSGCGGKAFVDEDVPCGERHPRTCINGRSTQNSYQMLLSILGPRGNPSKGAARAAALEPAQPQAQNDPP